MTTYIQVRALNDTCIATGIPFMFFKIRHAFHRRFTYDGGEDSISVPMIIFQITSIAYLMIAFEIVFNVNFIPILPLPLPRK